MTESTTARYAIYFAPDPASALWRFGSRTIGYDAASGEACAPVPPPGLGTVDWVKATDDPRRYGFHATLKAPFSLAREISETELINALAAFADGNAPLANVPLVTAALGAFVALVPEKPDPALQALAFRVVETFEPFRAPLSAADHVRRLASPLTPRQIELLDRYGYPYVAEQFRFHMTLTSKLAADEVAPVRDALAAAFAAEVPEAGIALDALALYRQASRAAPFRIIARFELTGQGAE